MRVLIPVVIELPPRIAVVEPDDFALPRRDQLREAPRRVHPAPGHGAGVDVAAGSPLTPHDHRDQERRP